MSEEKLEALQKEEEAQRLHLEFIEEVEHSKANLKQHMQAKFSTAASNDYDFALRAILEDPLMSAELAAQADKLEEEEVGRVRSRSLDDLEEGLEQLECNFVPRLDDDGTTASIVARHISPEELLTGDSGDYNENECRVANASVKGMVYVCLMYRNDQSDSKKNLKSVGKNLMGGYYVGPKIMVIDYGYLTIYDQQDRYSILTKMTFSQIETIKYKTSTEFKITTKTEFIYIKTTTEILGNNYDRFTKTDDFFEEFRDFEELQPKLTSQKKFSLGDIGSNIRFGILNPFGSTKGEPEAKRPSFKIEPEETQDVETQSQHEKSRESVSSAKLYNIHEQDEENDFDTNQHYTNTTETNRVKEIINEKQKKIKQEVKNKSMFGNFLKKFI